MSVLRNHALYWRGYVVADPYSESFATLPYQMSVKAVDGFNLLSHIPLMNLDGTQITGRRSLWSLMEMCVDLLELDLDVADWMYLYAEDMNENLSPMRQVYVDMERFYGVYSELPTAMCWNCAFARSQDRYFRAMVRFISAALFRFTAKPAR